MTVFKPNAATSTTTTPPQCCVSGKKIIVAGTGMAGLSFVISLRKHLLATGAAPPASITIYERETKETIVGREGYSLSIRSDADSGGMQILQQLGLLNGLLSKSFTGTASDIGTFTIWNTHWQQLFQPALEPTTNDLPTPTMRIKRSVLRQGLLDALPPEDAASIQWATACVGAGQVEGGKVHVELASGARDLCDLLIVADGGNGKLCSALRPHDRPQFAGAVMISGTARLPQGLPKPLDCDWGTLLGGGGTGLFASPVDQNSAVWSISYLSDQPRTKVSPPLRPEQVIELLAEARQRGRYFAEPLKTLIDATDPKTLAVNNTMDKQPFQHCFPGTDASNIVFIGDANHAISPFAGNGANMALMDGWDLAQQLCATEALCTAIEKFDNAMVPRSKNAIAFSHRAIMIAHAQGLKLMFFKALFGILRFFQRWKANRAK